MACWVSRERWLADVASWAASPRLKELCRTEKISIASTTLLRIAQAMAAHADHATGRNVAATRATIATQARCGIDTVTVAWRVLRTAGWALEAHRGHGSPATPSAGRRPSVYHLTSRRPDPENSRLNHGVPTTSAVEFPDLPRSGVVGLLTSVGSSLPRVRAQRAPTNNPSPRPPTRPRRRCRAAPRPLALQRLAAELVSSSHGLHRGHIGGICDALNSAGIDPEVWTARQITDALNADMRARGWSWPDRIERPGAFLASRLRHLDWRPAGPPTNNDGGYAAGIDKSQRAAAQTTTPGPQPLPASTAHRAEAMATIRATLHRPR